MEHQFNVDLAGKYGIEEAILINHIFFWINKNASNDKNYINGRYWTYASAAAMSAIFPYMSKSLISRKINNLVEKGVLLKDNFNMSAYDRTMWYAFTDNAQIELSNLGYPFCKMKNGNSKNAAPIPDSNTNIFTDIYKDNGENEFSQSAQENTQPKLRGTTEAKKCLFANSRFAKFEDFAKCFESPEYAQIDIGYYYHSVADWSASKGKMQNDWIATARNFIRGDKERGKLHLLTQPDKKDYIPMLGMSKEDAIKILNDDFD